MNIQVCDNSRNDNYANKNGPPFVLLEGGRMPVDKAESLINEILKIQSSQVDPEVIRPPMPEMNISNNTNNNSMSLVDRVKTLQNILGVELNPAENLSKKVIALEIELFGNAQKGTLAERIGDLENETG